MTTILRIRLLTGSSRNSKSICLHSLSRSVNFLSTLKQPIQAVTFVVIFVYFCIFHSKKDVNASISLAHFWFGFFGLIVFIYVWLQKLFKLVCITVDTVAIYTTRAISPFDFIDLNR